MLQTHSCGVKMDQCNANVETVCTFYCCIHQPRVAGLWSRSRRLGLEMVSRCINVSSQSHLDENCQRLSLVSVSAIDVSCLRPFFRQILQVTIIKLIESVVTINDTL